MTDLTVSAAFAQGLIRFAADRGADRASLLRMAGVQGSLVADQDARLPFSAYMALMRAAKALTGDEALALHFGEAIDISEISIVGLIGQASETMMDAFVQLNRYVRLVVETQNADGGERFQLGYDREGLWVIDARIDGDAFPELTESAFAQLVRGPRRFDQTPFVKAVHVTHADPGYGAEYTRIFRAPVIFGADRNALLIDPAWTVRRVEQLPRYAFAVLADRAEAMLEELDAGQSFRGEVERRLLAVLHTGRIGVDQLAADLGMSRQTVFRRLKAEGITFEQVLDDLRCRLARHYLKGRKVSVAETAYLVGFSDPAAFSRAFKRWTGTNPRDAREG